jgi:hypothetical protein
VLALGSVAPGVSHPQAPMPPLHDKPDLVSYDYLDVERFHTCADRGPGNRSDPHFALTGVPLNSHEHPRLIATVATKRPAFHPMQSQDALQKRDTLDPATPRFLDELGRGHAFVVGQRFLVERDCEDMRFWVETDCVRVEVSVVRTVDLAKFRGAGGTLRVYDGHNQLLSAGASW